MTVGLLHDNFVCYSGSQKSIVSVFLLISFLDWATVVCSCNHSQIDLMVMQCYERIEDYDYLKKD